MARFGSVITAMVTPFDADGRLDVAVAADLARWLVDQGSNGLVLTGTTGESPVLTDDEDVALWTAVRDAVPVPLIAGSGTNDTRHAVELTERATATGVDAVLIVTPYYNRPGQSGLPAWRLLQICRCHCGLAQQCEAETTCQSLLDKPAVAPAFSCAQHSKVDVPLRRSVGSRAYDRLRRAPAYAGGR
jgi:hypothetical protein